MAAPKLKAEERYEQLLDVFHSSETLDEMTFRIILRETENKSAHIDRVVEGLAYVATGRTEEGLAILEGLLPISDANHAKLFCHILFRTARLDRLDNCIYGLADKFQTKWLTFNAASVAYLLGRLSKCQEYLDMHIKLLSENEGRAEAELFKQEAVRDLDSAYRNSGCSAEQLQMLGKIVDKVMRRYPSSSCRAEVSGRAGGSYIVEVIEASPRQIAEMNVALADEICREEALDDCRMVARFSVDRKSKSGANYAYE